ncbi:IS1182 family transposase [Marinobacterium nitratireducens]|nr:IS1182 family transposase [Marinobacterium nitratireducens]
MGRRYKEGPSRHQLLLMPPSIEEYVDVDSKVRAIDVYVSTLDLEKLGFQNAGGELSAGQPAFEPAALLKLYLWGYLNRTRSSRRLERETYRNLEVIWLLNQLHPSYKTIADFRKNNPTALKAVNKDFILLCRELSLFGAELVAIDSAFMEGNASKASIQTRTKLKRLQAKLEADIEAWHTTLAQGDRQEAQAAQDEEAMQDKLARLKRHLQHCQQDMEHLEASGETQLSRTDPDARLLNKKTDKGPTAGFNVQCAVDSQHGLIIASDVVNDGNDQNQLARMALQAKENLGTKNLEVVADSSYYNQLELKACEDADITPFVAISQRGKHDGRFGREDFIYDPDSDCYRCPAGNVLKFSCMGKTNNGKQMRRYISSRTDCKSCPLRGQCLKEKSNRRQLQRWEHEEVVERHQQRMETEGEAYMKQRAALAEHPLGTIKMWAGWTHFLCRGLDKVRAEFSLMTLSYNFTRVLNILPDLERFREYCEKRVA